MPRDGQTIPEDTVILPDLLALAAAAVAPAEALLATATERLRAELSVDGRVSGALLEANQTAAHGLAWLATYVESLRQMQPGPSA
jgi:(2S)-methylsuccinyl-CoA dehydrogenase